MRAFVDPAIMGRWLIEPWSGLGCYRFYDRDNLLAAQATLQNVSSER